MAQLAVVFPRDCGTENSLSEKSSLCSCKIVSDKGMNTGCQLLGSQKGLSPRDGALFCYCAEEDKRRYHDSTSRRLNLTISI